MKPGLFVDRDGVLNRVVMRGEVVGSPRSLEEFEPIPEAGRLIAAAREAGYAVVVVTNQPDIGRGLMEGSTLDAMHAQLRALFPIDAFEVCGAGEDSDPRRKPNPGMILDSAERLGLDLARSWIVGDSPKDIEAGRRAGIRTVLLRTEYNRLAYGRADLEFDTIDAIADHFREKP